MHQYRYNVTLFSHLCHTFHQVMESRDRKWRVPTDGRRLALWAFSQQPLESPPCKSWVQNNCFKMTLLGHLHLCQDWKGTKISKENMDFRSITCFLCNPSFQVYKLYDEPMTENITLCVILKSSPDREKAKHPSILLEEPQEKLSSSFSQLSSNPLQRFICGISCL